MGRSLVMHRSDRNLLLEWLIVLVVFALLLGLAKCLKGAPAPLPKLDRTGRHPVGVWSVYCASTYGLEATFHLHTDYTAVGRFEPCDEPGKFRDLEGWWRFSTLYPGELVITWDKHQAPLPTHCPYWTWDSRFNAWRGSHDDMWFMERVNK